MIVATVLSLLHSNVMLLLCDHKVALLLFLLGFYFHSILLLRLRASTGKLGWYGCRAGWTGGCCLGWKGGTKRERGLALCCAHICDILDRGVFVAVRAVSLHELCTTSGT